MEEEDEEAAAVDTEARGAREGEAVEMAAVEGAGAASEEPESATPLLLAFNEGNYIRNKQAQPYSNANITIPPQLLLLLLLLSLDAGNE